MISIGIILPHQIDALTFTLKPTRLELPQAMPMANRKQVRQVSLDRELLATVG